MNIAARYFVWYEKIKFWWMQITSLFCSVRFQVVPWRRMKEYCSMCRWRCSMRTLQGVDVDVDVVDLRAQADASMPASNNNVKLYNISNF